MAMAQVMAIDCDHRLHYGLCGGHGHGTMGKAKLMAMVMALAMVVATALPSSKPLAVAMAKAIAGVFMSTRLSVTYKQLVVCKSCPAHQLAQPELLETDSGQAA